MYEAVIRSKVLGLRILSLSFTSFITETLCKPCTEPTAGMATGGVYRARAGPARHVSAWAARAWLCLLRVPRTCGFPFSVLKERVCVCTGVCMCGQAVKGLLRSFVGGVCLRGVFPSGGVLVGISLLWGRRGVPLSPPGLQAERYFVVAEWTERKSTKPAAPCSAPLVTSGAGRCPAIS